MYEDALGLGRRGGGCKVYLSCLEQGADATRVRGLIPRPSASLPTKPQSHFAGRQVQRILSSCPPGASAGCDIVQNRCKWFHPKHSPWLDTRTASQSLRHDPVPTSPSQMLSLPSILASSMLETLPSQSTAPPFLSCAPCIPTCFLYGALPGIPIFMV